MKFLKFSSVDSIDMSLVYTATGTIIVTGRNEIHIYIHKKYWEKLKPLIGKKVRILIIEEIE